MWLKGTPKCSGLLPSPQPLYATANFFNITIHIKSTMLKLEKKLKHFEILFLHILNTLDFKSLAFIATEI